jgi:formiminotetrahydrofolate cyclodeaminase
MTPDKEKEEVTLSQFLEAVAASTPTPGGGSVSALAGSLGAALVEMVVNLTLGKKGFAGKENGLLKIREEARTCREALTGAVSRDSLAYEAVMNAYLLPKKTEDEKKKRKEAIQQALKRAADPPLFTAAESLKVMHLCREAVVQGNPNAASDAAVGALLADAALGGGVFNVLVNLSALEDKHFAERMKKELQRLEAEGAAVKKDILDRVKEKIDCR